MTDSTRLVFLACFFLALLSCSWMRHLGFKRGLGAGVCRFLWLLPLLLAFFPQISSEELPRSLSLKTIHLLLDDSNSMHSLKAEGKSFFAAAEAMIQQLEAECTRQACKIEKTLLSSQDKLTHEGFTPLSRILEGWLSSLGQDPWLVLSDGGDFQPSLAWSEGLQNLGRANSPNSAKARGLIVSFQAPSAANLWISHVDLPPFAFEGKRVHGEITLERDDSIKQATTIQIQASLDGKILASSNTSFSQDASTSLAQLSIPALPRGRHLIELKALASPTEVATWDNQAYAEVEVMPNTVGVLHLLGSPSWDGRFLRRYLKAEPKYDLISFFILRDPWDSQSVDERELSLIPFPVARLFNEELPNFRVIILQNFTLLQFLQPEYQRNLVKFVKEGGGLFFLGGERALLSGDITNSPLKEILPFTVSQTAESSPYDPPFSAWQEREGQRTGPWFDSQLAFTVSLAQPKWQERALANVYEEWEGLHEDFKQWGNAQGLHHLDQVQFKEGSFTPLLTATTPGGQSMPLALASYPGKGRAIWLFSDSFWRLAQTPQQTTSREVYHRFMQAAMTWLMRQDLKKPLIARNFAVQAEMENSQLKWQVTLQGPAVPYFNPQEQWQVQICGQAVSASELYWERRGNQSLLLTGQHRQKVHLGQRCHFAVKGEHPAFGSVNVSSSTLIPMRYQDHELWAAPHKLQELSRLTGAGLVDAYPSEASPWRDWLNQQSGQDGMSLAPRYHSFSNDYWHFDLPWLYLLLLFMPLELLIRRWPQLTGS